MSVEEYSLKFTLFSIYSPSSVSNPSDEISMFLTGVFDLVKEEYCTAMIHGDLTLSRIIVYAQYIDESNLGRRGRDAERGRSDEKGKVNPGLRRGLHIKMFLMLLRPTER